MKREALNFRAAGRFAGLYEFVRKSRCAEVRISFFKSWIIHDSITCIIEAEKAADKYNRKSYFRI